MNDDLNVLYNDFNFDLDNLDETGDITLLSGIKAIENSIFSITVSNWDSMPFKLDFGANLSSIIGDDVNVGTIKYIEDLVEQQLVNNENRISVENVTCVYNENKLQYKILIEYKYKNVGYDFTVIFN